MSFFHLFEKLTGHQPFPWQEALYHRFHEGLLPSVCNIPTGLGKTNILAVWLIAWTQGAKVPRRLVYVVNRRTVVDQTTDEALRICANAQKLGITVPTLSTLRGQFVDNGAWCADPSRPAILCGTVDMIGSRLLFNGYRIGYRSRPLHAGFLGQDALIVHDEAHLEPAFQSLLRTICNVQRNGRDPFPFHVIELTATSKNGGNENGLAIGEDDLSHPIVKKRMEAVKDLKLIPVESEKSIADNIADIAAGYRDDNVPVIIFARKLEDVFSIQERLKRTGRFVHCLTGTMRGKERDELTEKPEFKRFQKDFLEGETAYLVCTSAGEVGIDISAARLVCDLSTFESMAQRLGRLNRYGEYPDARITVLHPDSFNEDELDQRRRKTLDLLRKLPTRDPGAFDASPLALNGLDSKERAEAFAPEPEILSATDIHFDAWALTTLRGKMPGRPPVEPFLHGISPWQPEETQVAWRLEVEKIQDGLVKRYPPEEILEEYPLKPHELLRDQSARVLKSLQSLARRHPGKPVWLMDENGKVDILTLQTLADPDAQAPAKKAALKRMEGKTILLPPSAGGLSDGVLEGNSEHAEDVADEWRDDSGGLRRKRKFSEAPKPDGPLDMALVLSIDMQMEDEDSEAEDAELPPNRYWHWYVRPRDVEDVTRASLEPVLLSKHSQDVRAVAERIVENLNLPVPLGKAVALAAEFHDAGKNRRIWQLGIGNPNPEEAFAKPGKPKDGPRWRPQYLSPYRHEFGSILDIVTNPSLHGRWQGLDEDLQQLVLHLVAAHHGRARPNFPAQERFDPNYPKEKTDAMACETIRRFSHLQRRFGRWGLAYLESLVRAADWAASAPFFNSNEESGAAP